MKTIGSTIIHVLKKFLSHVETKLSMNPLSSQSIIAESEAPMNKVISSIKIGM
nr:hypothetical protein [Aggregatimonas sangjinii]